MLACAEQVQCAEDVNQVILPDISQSSHNVKQAILLVISQSRHKVRQVVLLFISQGSHNVIWVHGLQDLHLFLVGGCVKVGGHWTALWLTLTYDCPVISLGSKLLSCKVSQVHLSRARGGVGQSWPQQLARSGASCVVCLGNALPARRVCNSSKQGK